jgi:sugar lactone lactonase YvrE
MTAVPDSRRAQDLGPQPFAPGDIFLAATDVDDSNVDLRRHAGDGRILHYDAGFNLKGELRTGRRGLVIGLDVNEAMGELYACDSQNRAVTRFAVTGARLDPWPFQPPRAFGAVMCDAQGRAVLGVHSDRPGATPPGQGGRGAFLYRVDPRAGAVEEFQCDFDGGKFGFHRVTHMYLTPDGRRLIYVSENGRRVMQFDLAAGRQLPDLFVLSPDEAVGTCGLALHPDGHLMMATGSGAAVFDAQGKVVRRIDVPERKGWSRLQRSKDGTTFYISNFFDGIVQRRDLATFAVVAERDIGRRYSLTGIAEYVGR